MLRIERSKDRRCKVYLAELNAPLEDSDSDDSDPMACPNSSHHSAPREFVGQPSTSTLANSTRDDASETEFPRISPEGDFFGNYQDMDIDNTEDGAQAPPPDVENDFEMEMDLDARGDDFALEQDIELDRPGANDSEHEPESDQLSQSDDDTEAQRAARALAEENLSQRPFIVEYRKQAGEPCEDLPGMSNQEQYGKQWSDSENPYAPFHSRMDWEIGAWAKLRGPSSTAFSELMAIPGVSISIYIDWITD